MKTKDFNNRNNVEAFEIGVDENLDIWDRDSGYTFGESKGWWATGYYENWQPFKYVVHK